MAGHGSPAPDDQAGHQARQVYIPTHEVWSENERTWHPLPAPGVHPGLDRLAAVGNPTRPIERLRGVRDVRVTDPRGPQTTEYGSMKVTTPASFTAGAMSGEEVLRQQGMGRIVTHLEPEEAARHRAWSQGMKDAEIRHDYEMGRMHDYDPGDFEDDYAGEDDD